jgi:hypothetical protein
MGQAKVSVTSGAPQPSDGRWQARWLHVGGFRAALPRAAEDLHILDLRAEGFVDFGHAQDSVRRRETALRRERFRPAFTARSPA